MNDDRYQWDDGPRLTKNREICYGVLWDRVKNAQVWWAKKVEGDPEIFLEHARRLEDTPQSVDDGIIRQRSQP